MFAHVWRHVYRVLRTNSWRLRGHPFGEIVCKWRDSLQSGLSQSGNGHQCVHGCAPHGIHAHDRRLMAEAPRDAHGLPHPPFTCTFIWANSLDHPAARARTRRVSAFAGGRSPFPRRMGGVAILPGGGQPWQRATPGIAALFFARHRGVAAPFGPRALPHHHGCGLCDGGVPRGWRGCRGVRDQARALC